jgi:hypothetical protein
MSCRLTVETRAPDEGRMNFTTTRRIVQIPIRGPIRYGTILSVSAHNPPAAAFIEWDNGGQEWIRDEDFAPLRIWLISEETREPEPKCSGLADALKHLLWV